MSAVAPEAFEVSTPAGVLRGERAGEGPLVVLAHGLTATRRYVIHGSRALERAGYEVASYDARGHGESDRPADDAYDYGQLAADLGAVIDALAPQDGELFLAGHSMGAHTIARYLLENPGRASAVAFIGPAFPGRPTPAESLAGWDELADGLEDDGVDGFISVYEARDWPGNWREVILRITRERLEQHDDIGAVAEALRGTPRSVAFDALSDLGELDTPALIVASHDEADPGHPHAIAQAWADAIPGAKLISEESGASPLAWQGGRLARELAAFFGEQLP